MSSEIDELNDIIKKNLYVSSCKSNKKKDFNSMSFLIDMKLSQSDCIKLGNGTEKVFSDIIEKQTKLENIKPKNKSGVKEKDHLFKDNSKKIIYYAELKSNLNLDTEKYRSTIHKCEEIVKNLKNTHEDYEIKWCLVGTRYINSESIPKNIKKKYSDIQNNLCGINNYFETLNVKIKFTEEEYCSFLNNIAREMFLN